MITIEDINKVAAEMGVVLIAAKANSVLDMYHSEQERDPGATWDLVVENCIDMVMGDSTYEYCHMVHPLGLNQCYGNKASACALFEREEEGKLCNACLVISGKGYCERSGRCEP